MYNQLEMRRQVQIFGQDLGGPSLFAHHQQTVKSFINMFIEEFHI